MFLRSVSCLHQGARALAALNEAGIPAVGIKGVAAVASIHRGPHERTLGDADLLLRFADLDRAVAALGRSGFRLDVNLAGYVEFSRRHPIVGNLSVSMFAPGGEELDLHWRMGSADVEAVLAAAQPAEVYGRRIAVASHAHGFLLGVHHLLRNDFELDRGIRDLLDCRAWLDALVDRGEAADLAAEAVRWKLGAPALAVASILAALCPAAPAARAIPVFTAALRESDRRQARALHECFLLQRSPGSWNVDLLRLLDTTRLVRFLTRRFGSGATYTPVSVSYEEPGISARAGALGRALVNTRWRLVWALRNAQARAFKHDMEAT